MPQQSGASMLWNSPHTGAAQERQCHKRPWMPGRARPMARRQGGSMICPMSHCTAAGKWPMTFKSSANPASRCLANASIYSRIGPMPLRPGFSIIPSTSLS
ncbi:hypothetical protein K523DRAFT_419639, partial [Schizophyllum commune Tattone D]